MVEQSVKVRQVVDWSAAFIAGIVSGLVFLILTLIVIPEVTGNNIWVVLRMLASPILGESILAPPATFSWAALIVGVLLHLVFSFALAVLLAVIIHRWGLLVGIVGGAVFGLAMYAISMYLLNYLAMSYLYAGFYIFKGAPFMWLHVLFGAMAGGIYESLEVEEFEVIEEAGA